eukprot:Nitzschia sp. Nitz4//scaffold47_size129522//119059//121402//NITZ4_003571-RA/size129522-snap-gene-0.202-mRNA-1//-1//CDS//3329552860//8606//frame0
MECQPTCSMLEEEAPPITTKFGSLGTILEAAFVDPAYTWPPPEGEGKNAIELQAGLSLMADDDGSVVTTASQKERMTIPPKPKAAKKGFFSCCRSTDAAISDLQQWQAAKEAAIKARKDHYAQKKEKSKAYRRKHRYTRVPEGILIYRLDTATHTLTLMSEPHSLTDTDNLVQEMVIASSRPSPDKTRRGMLLSSVDGQAITLVACEQRTAVSWLEAMDLMLANRGRATPRKSESREWKKNNLTDRELEQIEGSYLNLANYSNKVIRTKDQKKEKPTQSGIYYSIQHTHDPADEFEEEALESIAKRRAVIKDSWDFFRMICSLLRDRRRYHEVFRKLQLDPTYPYLQSMTGLNDPGDAGFENLDKEVIQKDLAKYSRMTRTQVAQYLCKQAEATLPSLMEICKALAGSLGLEEVGVGPIKEITAALKKAERKYEGDLLKITDFCRAMLVVPDLPTLLALLELARDSFGPLIRRVKLSTLKADHKPKPGGYRDCTINLELNDHICEIQVHIWPMWVVCGIDGFRHYRHCLEYNTDSFENAYDALDGLDRKTMAELIVMAEEAVAETPLERLEWFQEKYILDYFAEIGLFMKHGLHVWAEVTLRQLIRLRTESPDLGPEHHETILLYTNLEQVLTRLGKVSEAKEIRRRILKHETRLEDEKQEAEKSIWDAVFSGPQEAYDMIMDPNKKEREEEAKLRREVKASKRAWRNIRKERFSFLDNEDGISRMTGDEKKDADR